MAKSAPESRFRIPVECSVVSLGTVMVALAQIEHATVMGAELITDVPRSKQKQAHEVGSIDFLAGWATEHPTFKAKEAVNAFKADGRGNGTSAYHALTALAADGVLKKLSEGMYSHVAKHQPKKARPAKKQQKRRDVDHRTFVLRAASRNHGRFSTSWMKAQFVKDGRTPGNVSPSVSQLIKKKALKRVGDSEYVLLQKAAPKKTNGATPVIAEVAANG